MASRFLAASVLLLFGIDTTFSQSGIEISPDGRDTAMVAGAVQSGQATFKSDNVPFAVAPNWNCDLRMQVGGLAVRDVNNDQHPDVAVACYRSQSFPPYTDWRNFVLYNLGTQLQTSPGWWTRDSTSTTDVRIADFNNDQHQD